jgi:hypothetical protein
MPQDGSRAQSSLLIATDAETGKMIQQQLELLLHAHKCQQRSILEGDLSVCNVPNCHTMRSVLGHMTTCINGNNCQGRCVRVGVCVYVFFRRV